MHLVNGVHSNGQNVELDVDGDSRHEMSLAHYPMCLSARQRNLQPSRIVTALVDVAGIWDPGPDVAPVVVLVSRHEQLSALLKKMNAKVLAHQSYSPAMIAANVFGK